MSKKLSKYIANFDYFDKTLTVLFARSGEIFIISFASIIGAQVGIASTSSSLIFSLTTGIIKKLSKITRYKTRKHNKTVMLARSKLYRIETLISQALIDLGISHEKYKTTINEEENYRSLKENIRTMKSEKN